jgi:hypothetical protein
MIVATMMLAAKESQISGVMLRVIDAKFVLIYPLIKALQRVKIERFETKKFFENESHFNENPS